MAVSDPWKRYLDAGMELTQITRQRAEKLVRDLVKAGEVQRQDAQHWVEELVERSRRTTEHFGETVRNEVTRQMQSLGLVQPAQKAADEERPAPAKKATAKKPTAKKTAKKSASTTKKAAGES